MPYWVNHNKDGYPNWQVVTEAELVAKGKEGFTTFVGESPSFVPVSAYNKYPAVYDEPKKKNKKKDKDWVDNYPYGV